MPRRSKPVAAPEKLIGQRIAHLRKQHGMTQAELAVKLSMKQGLLSRYETGLLRLHGALVLEIAKALHVSTDEILGAKELKTNGSTHDRRFMRRLEQIERLPTRKKQALLSTIDSFLRGELAADR